MPPRYAMREADRPDIDRVVGAKREKQRPALLHMLGLDHERPNYRYGGRDFRLTDVKGNVVREILA